jgi:hypothetical protein
MGLRDVRLGTGARRRGARLPRLLGALAVMTSAATGVVAPGEAAAGVGTVMSVRVTTAPAPTPAARTPTPTPAWAVPPRPAPNHEAPNHDGEPARSSTVAERLWLLGGVALSLTAAGMIAIAAMRGRRNQ